MCRIVAQRVNVCAPHSSRLIGPRLNSLTTTRSNPPIWSLSRLWKATTNSADKTSYSYLTYLLFARLAAQRAFISCDNLLRPAAVSPPFFGLDAALPAPLLPLRLAHRALAAADNLARVLADIARRPLRRAGELDAAGAPPKSAAIRFSRTSICRRIETACSKDLRDRFIYTAYAPYSI